MKIIFSADFHGGVSIWVGEEKKVFYLICQQNGSKTSKSFVGKDIDTARTVFRKAVIHFITYRIGGAKPKMKSKLFDS